MTVRNAIPEDAAAIVDFQLKMALETESLTLEPEVVKDGVAALFHDPSKGCYFVAEEGGVVVASLMITYEWSDWRNGWVWWIQSVYTAPAFRRRGIYRALYAYVKSLVLESDNIRGIRLYVDKTNHPAQKVYSALGMNGEHYTTYEWMKKF